MTEDDDSLPAMLTREQLRDLLEMREDYKRVGWLFGFFILLAKWCAAGVAFVVAAQTIYANFVRGVIK
jgi:hypothetical protein